MLQRFLLLLLSGTLLLSERCAAFSTSDKVNLSNKMNELSLDASTETMVKAFEEDYLQTAQQADITASHNDLE